MQFHSSFSFIFGAIFVFTKNELKHEHKILSQLTHFVISSAASPVYKLFPTDLNSTEKKCLLVNKYFSLFTLQQITLFITLASVTWLDIKLVRE